MNHFDSEKINRYFVEFESNAELYGNDIETFIERRKIESVSAQQLRRTLQLSRNIDLLAGAGLPNSETQNRAEDLTKDLKGEYQFIRELGRGGMGTVWLAEQMKPLRKVAIKLILTDLDSQLVQRRFEAEQQSLAMMSHPGISKVIDAGSIEGKRPYFVMEYVDGIPITNYCNDHRLSLDDRLDLFLQLCDAIQHAHQKGIIHRDIKPGNILVTQIDGKPQVKVIDFGLAKIIAGQGADLNLTQANVALGSPMWMSPEQTVWKTKEGPSNVDTRSDVYSLGVILYQLLTNTTPIDSDRFADADRSRLFEAIRNEVPPYPSRRVSENRQSTSWLESQSASSVSGWKNTLRDDLDWVTMKALEKEPDRRYATVSALADDLRRFTSGNAVVARPPSATYQLKKYIARNKVASLATVVAVLSLIVCTGISIWFATDSIHSRKLAEEHEANAVRALSNSEQLLEFSTKDIDAANLYASGIKFSKDSLERLIRRAKEIDSLKLGDTPRLEMKLRMSLAHNLFSYGEVSLAKAEYEKILQLSGESELGDSDPTTLIVRNKLAFVHLSRKRYEIAKQLLNANKDLIAEYGPGIEPDIKLECELGFAKAKHTQKEVKDAIEEYGTVVSKCETLLPEGHPLWLDALIGLGEALRSQGEYEKADQRFKEAKSLSDNYFGVDSAKSLHLEMDILANEGEWKGSFFKPAKRLALLDEFVEKLGECNPKVLSLRVTIADSLMRTQKFEEALHVIEDGISSCHQRRLNRKFDLATLWFKKLELLKNMERYSDAIDFYESEIVPNLTNIVEENPDINVKIQYMAVGSFIGSGDSARASELIKKYEPIARRVEGDSGIIRNHLRNVKASILQNDGKYDEAVNILKDIVLQRMERGILRDISTANYYLGIGLDFAGRPLDALPFFERSHEVAIQVFDRLRPNRVTCEMELAEHYLYSRQPKKAFGICDDLLSVLPPNRQFSDLNELRFQTQVCLTESSALLGKLDIAQKLLEEIKKDAEKYKYLGKSPEMDRLDLIEGICHLEREDYQKAEDSLLFGFSDVSEKSGLERRQSIENTMTTRRYALQLATLYEKWGKHEKAKQFREMEFQFAS